MIGHKGAGQELDALDAQQRFRQHPLDSLILPSLVEDGPPAYLTTQHMET
ncbi:MAG: hypothetical protein AAGI68_07935 [Planctomycetota bacterium]